ncbi:MAG: N-acetylneuraminate synthase family protein [Myxococcota bacterium]
MTVSVGAKRIGQSEPCYLIAEIGINHNGDVDIAKRLIDAAALAGFDAVKFQKRTPELCVPVEMRDVQRETPWGIMSYMDYRERVEFGETEFRAIDDHCRSQGVSWFASPWDEPSVEFLEQFDLPCFKVASASITDDKLLRRVRGTGKPVMISTGMSSSEQIDHAIKVLGQENLLIAHCTSSYPCPPEELNLLMIETLRATYTAPIGYSGHEVGLQTTLAAVVMGACFVERHVTLDRAMWGSDQAASVEPGGMMRLARDIRTIEKARGDGVKQVYPTELKMQKRLRRAQ